MKNFVWLIAGLVALGEFNSAGAGLERELIQDNHFQRGFVLWKTEPGKHVRYGEFEGPDAKATPVWGLSQWSSKFPLVNLDSVKASDGAVTYSNSAKAITVAPLGAARADFCMSINTGVEYSPRSRNAGEPWVHLLVEQEFEPTAPLAELSAVKFHVEARLLRSQRLAMTNYSPNVHAAQFTIFFTVQNRNRQSRGFGDLVWFGIPIYDDRARFANAFKEQDFGGTAKFIFTPEAKTFMTKSTQDGGWVIIEKDLLPLMREALETAWSRGFLTGSKELADYHIGGMNLGWELPGSFDVEMQVRSLSLKGSFTTK